MAGRGTGGFGEKSLGIRWTGGAVVWNSRDSRHLASICSARHSSAEMYACCAADPDSARSAIYRWAASLILATNESWMARSNPVRREF